MGNRLPNFEPTLGPGYHSYVTPNEVLRELETLARKAGISVRHEPFDPKVIEGKGGLCWFHGNPIVMLDAGAPVLDKIGVLADALARFDIKAMYVPPALQPTAPLRKAVMRRPPRPASDGST